MLFDHIYISSIAFLPYCILSLCAMVEGPVATLMGGVATSSGLLLPLPVYFSIVIGDLTADMGWYSLGRYCKFEWLLRLSSKVGIDPERVEGLQQGIQRHAPRLLFFSKLMVGFPIPTLIATGLSRVPVRRWVGMLILGELVKSAALVLAGYLFSRVIQQASIGVQVVLWGISALVLVIGMAWFRRYQKNKSLSI